MDDAAGRDGVRDRRWWVCGCSRCGPPGRSEACRVSHLNIQTCGSGSGKWVGAQRHETAFGGGQMEEKAKGRDGGGEVRGLEK